MPSPCVPASSVPSDDQESTSIRVAAGVTADVAVVGRATSVKRKPNDMREYTGIAMRVPSGDHAPQATSVGSVTCCRPEPSAPMLHNCHRRIRVDMNAMRPVVRRPGSECDP